MAGLQPPINKEQTVHQLLTYLKMLRTQVQQITDSVAKEGEPLPDNAQLAKWFKQVEGIYAKMEQLALQLPVKSEPTEPIQKLTFELSEEYLDLDLRIKPVLPPGEEPLTGKAKIDGYTASSKYLDVFNTFAYFNEQFTKISHTQNQLQRRRPTILDTRPLTFTAYTPQNSPHSQYMAAFAHAKYDAAQKRHGAWVEILEEGSNSSIIELKAGTISEQRQVIAQKTLIVETNGSVDMVVFLAPHEEWKYLDEFGEYGKKVDIMHRSRYLVYQKLTTVVNTSFIHYLIQYPTEGRTAYFVMQQIFQMLVRYHRVFETKCRNCGKVMKDYLPPILFDPRQPAASMHESCR